MKDEDLIRSVLVKVMALQPLFTESMALEVEQKIRHEWGGEEVYVGKDMRRQPHARAQIEGDIAAKRPAREIVSEHGVSSGR